MSIQPVIKWTGSKRSQAAEIVNYFPNFNHYYEPFVGGGSVMFAAHPTAGTAGDICTPLIELWKLIRDNPEEILSFYTSQWQRLQDEGHTVYYEIRDTFNESFDPLSLFFLTRTCVNGLIRFNQVGEFNNSLHHTRKGINPSRLRSILYQWSHVIRNIDFFSEDYRVTTAQATSEDFIYLDPPYFHTRGRYYGHIDFDEFLAYLEYLNSNNIYFALSYDGFRGEKEYLTDIPQDLYKRKLYLASGNSAFKKVQESKTEAVYEALYLNY